ncbi:DUF2796 domain-containing protein [Hyphomonas sp.]|uniref:ZrgA family zinc uptake protein n=1 Tax=Hyphomonas sp. TaxID=87 RepID=UPI0025C291BF|nr:DUF2796 domain-containing protein [Hyphomonas sp.]
MKPSALLSALIASGIIGLPLAQAETRAPHVHGAADLAIIMDGDQISAHLTSAMYNITGFEHAPETIAQQDVLESAIATLDTPDKIFEFTSSAACRSTSVHHSLQPEAGPDTSPHEHHGKEESQHRDLVAEYAFTCEHPSRLKAVTVHMFASFKNLERINAIVFIGDEQIAPEVTPHAPTISLPSPR